MSFTFAEWATTAATDTTEVGSLILVGNGYHLPRCEVTWDRIAGHLCAYALV